MAHATGPISPEAAVDSVMQVLKKAETHDYIGEPVSQLQHALEAAHLAAQAGADDETILAALCHDLGHLVAAPGAELMANVGVKGHERIGGAYLRRLGFSSKVAELVEAHVMVKRYLVFKYPAYHDALSSASKITLKYQGGPMTADEAAAFEADPLFELKCLLRKWDEAAKEVHMDMPGLDHYRPMMLKHLLAQRAGA